MDALRGMEGEVGRERQRRGGSEGTQGEGGEEKGEKR